MKIERLERHWPGDITAHYDFGPRLNIVVVPDRDRVPSVFDAAVTALSGPPRRHATFKRTALQPTDELRIEIAIQRCDGRRFRVSREMTSRPGHFKLFDADSGEPVFGLDREGRSDLLLEMGRDRFEALARVSQSDLWTVASMGRGFEQVLRKNAVAVGANAAGYLVAERARAAISGEHVAGAQFPGSPLIWARAREVDLGRRISEARELHAEAASARAALRRCTAAAREARAKADQARYFALVAQQSTLVATVAKIRSLEEEIRRLTPEPLATSAHMALRLAPEIDRAVGRIAALERNASAESAKVPEPPREIIEIEAKIAELESAIEEQLILPAAEEPDPIIRRAYEDWRRLCGESEAAEFAAAMARADAAEVAKPSPGVARLAKVTTADRLRSRLTARTAAQRERDATDRRRDIVLEKIKDAKLSVATLLEETYLARLPISLLAGIEDAHAKAEQLAEEFGQTSIFRFRERRSLRAAVEAAKQQEAASLLQAGCGDYEAFAASFERSTSLIGLAIELSKATSDLAGATARLRDADDEVSKHASGAAASKAAELLGELEAHQSEIAAAEEIREEAYLAASTAASLRASRDTAANELLARLRPYRIRETDPARAWSMYKLACARKREQTEAETEMDGLNESLAPYRETYAALIAARAAVREDKARLCTVLAQIPECGAGSYSERLGNFTRLRDEALLEQKLDSARRQIADEYEKNLDGLTRTDWEARLVAAESRLSELEEAHPDWGDIQITGSEQLLVKAADEAEAHLARLEAEETEAHARLDACSGSLPDVSLLNEEMTKVRGDLGQLEHLRTRIESLASKLVESDAGGEVGPSKGRPWKSLPARVSSETDVVITDGGVKQNLVTLDGSAALELAPPQRAGTSGSHLDDYLMSRFALMTGWGPSDEHIPFLVEDAFSATGRAQSREILDLLAEMATVTQVVVTTSWTGIAELAEGLDPEMTRVITEPAEPALSR